LFSHLPGALFQQHESTAEFPSSYSTTGYELGQQLCTMAKYASGAPRDIPWKSQ